MSESTAATNEKEGWSSWCRRGETVTCVAVGAKCANPAHRGRRPKATVVQLVRGAAEEEGLVEPVDRLAELRDQVETEVAKADAAKEAAEAFINRDKPARRRRTRAQGRNIPTAPTDPAPSPVDKLLEGEPEPGTEVPVPRRPGRPPGKHPTQKKIPAPVIRRFKGEAPPAKKSTYVKPPTLAEQVRPILEEILTDADREWNRVVTFHTAAQASMNCWRLRKAFSKSMFEWEHRQIEEVDQSAIYVRWTGHTGEMLVNPL